MASADHLIHRTAGIPNSQKGPVDLNLPQPSPKVKKDCITTVGEHLQIWVYQSAFLLQPSWHVHGKSCEDQIKESVQDTGDSEWNSRPHTKKSSVYHPCHISFADWVRKILNLLYQPSHPAITFMWISWYSTSSHVAVQDIALCGLVEVCIYFIPGVL